MDKEIVKITHISDTHTFHEKTIIPEDTDILICSGDVTKAIDPILNAKEFETFISWWNDLKIPHKILIAGNHEISVGCGLVKDVIDNIDGVYLEHEEAEVNGFKVFGSPYCPVFGRWPFMRVPEFRERAWSHVPTDIDILITHSPPLGIRDQVFRYMKSDFESCGCEYIADKVAEMSPLVHCFGHIHDGHSSKNSGFETIYGTIFSNGSVMKDNKWGKEFNTGNTFTIKRK